VYFYIIRQNFFTDSYLKDLFHNIHTKVIFYFIHATGLTNKLQTISGTIYRGSRYLRAENDDAKPSIHPYPLLETVVK